MPCTLALDVLEHYGRLAGGVLLIMAIYLGGRWLMTRQDRRDRR